MNVNTNRQIDYSGQRFGRLVCLEWTKEDNKGVNKWKCRCDCGNITFLQTNSITTGKVISCGCFKREIDTERLTKHGLASSKLHNVWKTMRQRCLNPKDKAYPRYGGRGISICEEWNDFVQFFEDMAPSYEDGLTLERIDVDGNYCKENCKWASYSEQNRNRRSNILVEVDGVTKCLLDWCNDFNIVYTTAVARYYHGIRGKELFNKERIKNNGN